MNYQLERFLLMTLDPVHIGTGGYRLGRVDNSIMREPGTNLPKIPGTSLSGAIRTYAAYCYESLDCAGQGQASEKTDYQGHCGNGKCPICYTFGSLKVTSENGNQQAYAGVVNLCDAHLLCFPVHSMAGPVWVSTKDRLEDFGFKVEAEAPNPESCLLVNAWAGEQQALNLGWLMLNAHKNGTVGPPNGCELDVNPAWQMVKDRLVLVSDKVFTQVVNSNLEVRTSVAIDPTTGAAQEGALFTYEAIPRATWLVMEVVEDDYHRDDKKPWPVDKKAVCEKREENGKKTQTVQHNAGDSLGETWKKPLDVVRAGLKLVEVLGVGGMGTRGFGRVRTIADWQVAIKSDRNG
ncbi:MAG TPA: type III-B CRISPR module RAMP protein Cmr4 [Candidatus Fraserbacteria bacterium]|nr:type III-B CRISPR module RAMP protein Cmr4 [Candidatus Fraserbacteria bacterium]